MNNFCVIDIETKGLSARPESFVFGCIYADNFRKHFMTREAMVNYIYSQKRFKYIFAHNAEYDFTCLFDNIILKLDNEALFVGSMFVKAKNRGKVFMNSLAILKSSVSELGKNYGVEKMILDDKFKNAKPDTVIEVTKEDIEYCYRDCEIVYDYLVKMFTLTKKMKPTVASCAMEIFTKEFLNRKIFYNEVYEKFRHSYYGGRVECFRFGKINPCYKYDVNSIYPYVCTKMVFPDFNKLKKGKTITASNFQNNYLQNYEGCTQVTVSHKKNFVGVLPYRNEKEIIYPFGSFKAWYNFNELRKAVATGFVSVLKVHEYYYAPKFYFTELADFMKFFYNKKNETEGAEKLLNKFILNALTGKFGQKPYGKKIYFTSVKKALEYLHSLNGKIVYAFHHFSEDREDLFLEIFREEERKKSNWNVPAISSYITSEARIYMLDFYLKNANELCYTDTDSLVLNKPLDKKYISPNELGGFKEEADEQIEVIGNKHYYSVIKGKKYKNIKGVHKKHTRKKGKFCFNKMIRTKEAMRRNLKAGSFVAVEKTLSKGYTKRTVKNNVTQTLKLTL